ncbi:MAG: GNAT family N-acetyltransferase [Caldilineaceae bacterium]
MSDQPTAPAQFTTPEPLPSGERLELVTVWHLEMLSPDDLAPSIRADKSLEGLSFVQALIPQPEFNRFLYAAVGGDWYWRDRLSWDYARWVETLMRPGYETWVAYMHGSPAGYFELDPTSDSEGSVEIADFGLLHRFIGRGIGGPLLTRAIARGWEKGARRVWVHTCSLDHPAALANYQARGLRVFHEETLLTAQPASPVGLWPGANRA